MAERLRIGAVGHVIAEVIAHAREMLANLRQEVVGRHTGLAGHGLHLILAENRLQLLP
jgi:hypothetical protein